jgi:Bacterial regulatory proteins, tetR family
LHIKLSSRLSFNERRQAIIEAVKDVFANTGFDGTTSRELAKAAGISEALLYKYFPTKLSLYNAMLGASLETPGWLVSNHLEALKPSTGTLITMVDSLVSHVLESRSEYIHDGVLGRLAVRSLLDDGAFARVLASGMILCSLGCGKSAQPQARPPDVEVVKVEQKDVPIWREWIGTLDGLVNAQIKPQVIDYPLRQTYTDGAFVKKGQLLFEIDPRPFEAYTQPRR